MVVDEVHLARAKREAVETRFRAAFEQYLDELRDVMGLYYSGRMRWDEALRLIAAAREALAQRHAGLTRELAS